MASEMGDLGEVKRRTTSRRGFARRESAARREPCAVFEIRQHGEMP